VRFVLGAVEAALEATETLVEEVEDLAGKIISQLRQEKL